MIEEHKLENNVNDLTKSFQLKTQIVVKENVGNQVFFEISFLP